MNLDAPREWTRFLQSYLRAARGQIAQKATDMIGLRLHHALDMRLDPRVESLALFQHG